LEIVLLEAHRKELEEGTRKFKIRHWTKTSKAREKSEIIEVMIIKAKFNKIWPLTL